MNGKKAKLIRKTLKAKGTNIDDKSVYKFGTQLFASKGRKIYLKAKEIYKKLEKI